MSTYEIICGFEFKNILAVITLLRLKGVIDLGEGDMDLDALRAQLKGPDVAKKAISSPDSYIMITRAQYDQYKSIVGDNGGETGEDRFLGKVFDAE